MKTTIELTIAPKDGGKHLHLYLVVYFLSATEGMEVELFDGSASAPINMVFYRPHSNDILARTRNVFVADADEAEALVKKMYGAGWLQYG